MLAKIALLNTLLSTLAIADERGAFVSLDRADRDSFVSIGLANTFGGPDNADVALHANVYARFVWDDGAGVYGQVGFAAAHGFMSWSSGASDMEVGGFVISHHDGLDVIWRFGLGLPTASSDSSNVGASLAAFPDRILDYPLIAPETVWLRPGVVLRFGGGAFFEQVDGGIDIPIETRPNEFGSGVMAHLNGGVGTHQGVIDLTGELANDVIGGFHMLHSLTVSIRWRSDSVQPYLAGGLAFGDQEYPTTTSVTAGIGWRL